MTTTARDLVEAGAIATYERTREKAWIDAPSYSDATFDYPEIKAMLRLDTRAALIATLRKLAEDGPTEAMLEAWERIGVIDRYMARQLCVVGNQALLRELKGLTP
jgi:hypothetical protein